MQINCKLFKMKTAKILGQTWIVNKILDKQNKKIENHHTCMNKMHSSMWNVLLRNMYENEREIYFYPYLFSRIWSFWREIEIVFNLVHTIPIYEKYEKDTNRIFLSNFTSLDQHTIMKETIVTGLSTVCTSGSTYKLEMLVFIELISTFTHPLDWVSK